MNASPILNQIKELYPDVRIYISENDKQIYLHNLQVPPEKRGQGIGKNIIKLLKDYAKLKNKPLSLEPSPDRGYKKKLEKFYKDLGFVPNKGRNLDQDLLKPFAKTMYYKPTLEFTDWLNEAEKIPSVIQQDVYHSSNEDFKRFNLKNATQKIIWFTSDQDALKRKEKGAQGGKIIYTLKVDIKNPAGWEEYDKYMLDQLKQMGYDGAVLPEKNGYDGFVFSPKQIKIISKEIV